MKPASPPTRNASDTTHAPSTNLKRRRLLFALSAAGGASAAAAAAPIAAQAEVATAAQDTSQGYRETEHVLDYYASTRL